MFIHLNVHSAYSLLEGVSLPEELVKTARADNMTALGLTDHRTMIGAIEFVKACHNSEIQPILGLEVDLINGSRLPLLATSIDGWSNLCRLSSFLALSGDSTGSCSLDALSIYSKDLIALSDGHTDIERLTEIFPGSLFITFQNPARGLALINLGRKLNLPLVVTHPIYYISHHQTSVQRTLTAIRLIKPIAEIPPENFAPPFSHFLSSAEMNDRFQHYPKALEMTIEIAERCKFNLPIGTAHMPKVPLPDGQTATLTLRSKAEKGAIELYGSLTPEIRNRLDHEIDVIARMGYEPIFLIVEELLNFARENGIPYSSRGSAASSLVAHCLGITSPDPLRLNLYFERFLNPARTTPPDIDTDLCSLRRDRVIQHVFDIYGSDQVAMVATINRFRPRSALGDAAKAWGMAPIKIRELCNQLPNAFWARFDETDQDSLPKSPFADLRQSYPSGLEQQIFDAAEALLHLPRHLSIHPGGVIVAPGPITDLVPVMHSGNKNMLITQLDLESVETLGLVKIDLLGIRGLTVLGDVAEFIQKKQPDRYLSRLSVLDSTPSEDSLTSDRIENGQTIGCFQIESPGMRSTLREIHARNEDDIMATLALYRPGPLSGGLKDAFVRRFKGSEPIQHLHPALKSLLDETYGVILYQEQVLRIAHEVAGFSLADADLLRRAMSHFDPGKRMQELEHKFVSEAQLRSGVPTETGERIWEMMAAFAGYGFPKAHAASYARIAWRSAWCKTHFPAEFMAAVLANWGGYYSQRVYLSEARRMGLKIKPPHINFSGMNFGVGEKDQNSVLYMGLDQIKDLSRRTIDRIIRFRPFVSVDDFLIRTDPRADEAKHLALVGAFEGLGIIPAILQRLENGWQEGQMSMFAWKNSAIEDLTIQQKMASQNELLGISLEAHPLELVTDKIKAANAISILDAANKIGQQVTIAAIRQTSHKSRTANGETMLFLSMEDLTGSMDAVIFPNVYQKAKNLLNSSDPFLISGTMELDTSREEMYLRAEKINKIE